MNSRVAVRALCFPAVLFPALAASAQYSGPSLYQGAFDTPFASVQFDEFYLEDFEDGSLNTPNVISTTGGVVSGPGAQIDSVDFDDGQLDGLGLARSLYSGNSTTAFTFEFTPLAAGFLPTHAGIVWTDVGASSDGEGFGFVIFEAFDAGGVSLGATTPVLLGDGSTFSETPEDRFFGVSNAGGVSRIVISMPGSTDWEVDHLQYGFAIPAPGAVAMSAGLAGLLIRRRRGGL